MLDFAQLDKIDSRTADEINKEAKSQQHESSNSIDENAYFHHTTSGDMKPLKSKYNQTKINILKNRKSSSTPVLTESSIKNNNEANIVNLNAYDDDDLDDDADDLNADKDMSQTDPNLSVLETDDAHVDLNSELVDSTDTIGNLNVANTTDEDSANSSFRAYYSPASTLLEKKKILRHHSLQNTHDKSQSANNLVSFVNNMQLTVSEPNVLNNENNKSENPGATSSGKMKIKEGNAYQYLNSSGIAGPPTSSSSSYLPLETTMEECLESLDISYDASLTEANTQSQMSQQHSNVLNLKTDANNEANQLNKSGVEKLSLYSDDADLKDMLLTRNLSSLTDNSEENQENNGGGQSSGGKKSSVKCNTAPSQSQSQDHHRIG